MTKTMTKAVTPAPSTRYTRSSANIPVLIIFLSLNASDVVGGARIRFLACFLATGPEISEIVEISDKKSPTDIRDIKMHY